MTDWGCFTTRIDNPISAFWCYNLYWDFRAHYADCIHDNSRLFLTRKPSDPVWFDCHHNVGLFRFVTVSHGPRSVRPVCNALSFPNTAFIYSSLSCGIQTTQHSTLTHTTHPAWCIHLLHFKDRFSILLKGDTCLFNYADNLIMFYSQRQGTRV